MPASSRGPEIGGVLDLHQRLLLIIISQGTFLPVGCHWFPGWQSTRDREGCCEDMAATLAVGFEASVEVLKALGSPEGEH